jgi:hypothetical protein
MLLAHGKKQTFWMSLSSRKSAPRFLIEKVIKHLKSIDHDFLGDKNIIGAEWWIQNISSYKNIGFHYDKDEGEASLRGRMYFPQFSTVTYLTSSHAPTLIFNMTTDGNTDFPPIPTEGFLSFPQISRHTIFK